MLMRQILHHQEIKQHNLFRKEKKLNNIINKFNIIINKSVGNSSRDVSFWLADWWWGLKMAPPIVCFGGGDIEGV